MKSWRGNSFSSAGETGGNAHGVVCDSERHETARKAQVRHYRNDLWPVEEVPRAPDDLKWLLDRADKLASDRNNAIHAPCSLYLRGDGSSEVMAAVRSANAGNRRAKNLEGKDLLIEFRWCAAMRCVLASLPQCSHPRWPS